MKYLPFILLFLLSVNAANAQTIEVSGPVKTRLLQAVDSLFAGVNAGKIDSNKIAKDGFDLTLDILSDLKGKDSSNVPYLQNGIYKKLLVNRMDQLSANQYKVSILYTRPVAGQPSEVQTVFMLIATSINNHFVFALPLKYLTQSWKSRVVGNITYHYCDSMNINRAMIFDAANTRIATKFGLEPQKLDFYLCDDHRAIFTLLGYDYDLASKDRLRDGYGVAGHTIFSVMHNEDFSHDLFHYYSAMIRTNVRNRSAEEGFAYTWGNAYYTDDRGEVITQRRLALALKTYLTDHPDCAVWTLFNDNPKIFNSIAKEVSVKTTISSLICDEVERKAGVDGVKQLLNCGTGDEAYFKVVNKLTGINLHNFNTEIVKLIEQYH